MGAEVKYYVAVETVQLEWRESYGVTREDAIANVRLDHYERTTNWVVTEQEKYSLSLVRLEEEHVLFYKGDEDE
jgi:hypothetical protein